MALIGSTSSTERATIRGGVTKTDVGLSNVDNDSTATIRGGVTKSDVGLGSVTDESKSTMFSSPTFTGTIYAYSGGGIRQSEGTDGSDYGHFARRQSWVNSSSMIICQWGMGAHHCSNFIVHFAWTDW